MKTLTLYKGRVSARLFAVLTIFSLLLSAFPAAFFVAEAQVPSGILNTIQTPFVDPQTPIPICHWSIDDQDYDEQEDVNLTSIVDGTGHGDHEFDILPPFWHQLDDQDPQLFPGQNWDTEGQELWENGCQTPSTTGSITIAKVAGGDTTTEFDFTGTLGGFALVGGSDTEDTYAEMDPGQYTITESDEEGWELLDINCDGEQMNSSLPSVTIDLEAGDDVTCTFTNRPDQEEDGEARIKVFKWIVGEDKGPATTTDFSFQIDDEDPISFNQFGFAYDTVSAGTHVINEVDIPADYDHLKTICKEISGYPDRDENRVLSMSSPLMKEIVPNGWQDHASSNEITLDDGDLGVCLILNKYDPDSDPGTEYGDYCGDGEVNQGWEQCDEGVSGGASCTAQCQPVEQNQCSDLTLAKIDMENVSNSTGVGDMTDDIYLGQGALPIPNNVWFMVYWNGSSTNDAAIAAYEDVPGLAVQRLNGSVRSVMHGTNGRTDREHVEGTIEFWSGNDSVGAVGLANDNSNAFPRINNLEGEIPPLTNDGTKGLEGDDEVWLVGDVAHFWLTTTTADDGFYTEYNAPVACEEPPASVCESGNNLLLNGSFEEDIVTDNSGNWEIFSTVTNWAVSLSDGLELWANAFYGGASDGDQNAELDGNSPTMITQTVSTVPGATYELRFDFSARPDADSSADNSVDALVDGGLLMNVTADGSDIAVNTWTTHSDTFVAGDSSTDISFKDIGTPNSYGSLIDNAVLCLVPESQPETYRIDGYKYETEGESTTTTPLAGWTINLLDSEDTIVASTTTNVDGYYYFDVEAGDWEVSEVMQTDWNQVSVEQDGALVDTDADVESCSFNVPGESDYDCDFTNGYIGETGPVMGCTDPQADNYNPAATEDDGSCINPVVNDDDGRSYSSGTRINRLTPTPLVLGATTNSCPFLTDYMQMGVPNDQMEVRKLQMFLNIFRNSYGGVENPVTGFFGAVTDANVKAFQAHYRAGILDPWYVRGIVGNNQSTGFVYKTTLWKINSIVCPDYAVLPNFEGEDLTANVALDVPPISD